MDQKRIIWGLIGILIFITFYPLLKVGLVTGDDFVNLIWPVDRLADDSILYAQSTGRFYFLFALWIYKIPYLIDSEIYFHITLILPHLIALLLFVYLMYRIFKNEQIAMLTAVVSCIIFQIYGGHTATAGYPFYFTISFSLILLSLHILISYFSNHKYVYLLLSSLIFFIATLFYETYLVYYIFIFILVIRRYQLKGFFSKNVFFKFLREIVPFVIFGIIYLSIYFLYIKSYASVYEGNQISSNLTIYRFLWTIGNMSLYSLPLSSLFDYRFFLTEYSLSERSVFNLFEIIFTQAGLAAYIKGFIAVFAIWMILSTTKINFKNKNLIYLIIASALFIILPHLPLSLSTKYTNAIQNTYVSTYFSFFGVAIFCISLFLLLNNFLRNNKILKSFYNIFLYIIVFFVTLSIQFVNERVTDDLNVAEKRIKIMEAMLKKEYIENNAPIYVGSLHRSTSYFSNPITRQSNSFNGFAKIKNNLDINQYIDYNTFYNQYKSDSGIVYTLYFSQASKTGDLYLSVLRCRGFELQEDMNQNKGDSLWVGYFSRYKKFGVGISSDSCKNATIEGVETQNLGTFHFNNLNFLSRPTTCVLKIKGENLYPVTLSIVNQLYPNISSQMIGAFPKKYESAWVHHIMRELNKNKDFENLIQKKADQYHIPYKSALKQDAQWVLYYQFQN